MATTKRDLVARIAESTGTTHRCAKAVVQAFLDEVTHELAQGNRIELRDFGVFETRIAAPRMAQNPKTLDKIRVPAKCRAVFKPGRLMKDQVNGHLM
ncbi:HU family DNA-binding protein [Anaerobaca lacustris]|uniref:HU family DNA-binding protein n=1 Tax=Anaerobaca lacustris TaxID=3044600 RepID=A0AAW6U4K2_9BACT|nr:HU family DNA-binding protein [Sedimentisphaerales bacterium M17dextr]